MILLRSFAPVNLMALAAAAFLASAPASPAGDWPNLRGPDHTGISPDAAWAPGDELKIAWRAEVGLGHSAVVVAAGKAYTLGHDGKDTDTLWCLDAATGAVLWRHSYPHPLDDLYYPGGTAGTPLVEGGLVYSLARRGQLFCLDAATGEVKWQRHLADEFGAERPDWGFAGSPRVHGDLLLINAGGGGLALKKADGALVWKSGKGKAGYSTPHVFRRGDRELAIFSDKDGYSCADPATGERLWHFKHKTRYGVNAAEPVIDGDRIFLSSGYGKGAAMLEWSGSGDPRVVWQNRGMQNQMNPSLLIGGYLYGISGNEGQSETGLKCLDPATGETVWTETSVGHGAITAAGGKLIVLAEGGELLIAPASPEGFSPRLSVQAVAPKCWTTPVLAGGLIYCRNDKGQIAAVNAR